MKYLEIPQLGLLAAMLSDSSQSVRVTTRIEAYSCKSVASERKLIKSLDHEFTSDLEISTSTSSSSPDRSYPSATLQSAFGRLDNKDCRKTFWLLIATLNAAYPDHNFSHVKVEHFQAESPRSVLLKLSEALQPDGSPNHFASTLGALSTSPDCAPKDSSYPQDLTTPPSHPHPLNPDSLTGIHPLLRQFLDPVIDPSNCLVYSYSPDPDSDPHAVVSDEDDEEVESVASSIYGSNRHEPLQTACQIDPSGDTMWEIEGVEAPMYIQSNTDQANLSCRSTNLPVRTISTPSSPLPAGTSPSGCSNRTPTMLDHPNLNQNSYPYNSSNPPDCHTPSFLSPLSSSCDSTYEEESAGGLLWSSHYFFYNRKMKRILFVSTWGRKAWMASTSMNETSMAHHPSCDQVDYLLNHHPISSTSSIISSNGMSYPGNRFGEPSPSPQVSIQSMDETESLTDRSTVLPRQIPIDHPNHRRSSKLSKRLESGYPQSSTSFKRSMDRSDVIETTNSSVFQSSRPQKKKKSMTDPKLNV